jgi:hypothetical protein
MTVLATADVRDLLSGLEDTHELVLRAGDGDPLMSAWRSAASDSRDAYATWCVSPGNLRHAAYIAAEERADAALTALAATLVL